jgi:hypothetical protein
MVLRCHDESDAGWKNYGARGIRVCDRWRSFETFLRELPPGYSAGLELDRVDNDGNYEPGNVRWATHKQNQANTRKTRLVSLNGEELPLREAARRLNIHHRTLGRWLGDGKVLPAVGVTQAEIDADLAPWPAAKGAP